MQDFLKLAKKEYPLEVVALLGGEGKKVDSIFIPDQLMTEDSAYFNVEVDDVAKLFLGKRLMGAIHSHPDAVPVMSEPDMQTFEEHPEWKVVVIVEITKVNRRWRGIITAWRRDSCLPLMVEGF